MFHFDASWFNTDCDELHHAYCERVEAEVTPEINLDKFKLYRITSILPGTYTLNFGGTIDADNTFNLRVWGATYMSLGSKLFQPHGSWDDANKEWIADSLEDSRLVNISNIFNFRIINLYFKDISSFCK